MNRYRMVSALAVCCLFGVGATPAQSEIVKLEFNSLPPNQLILDNFEINGFRVSPRCHFDQRFVTSPFEGTRSIFLGADRAGDCEGQLPPPPYPPGWNTSYLGAVLPESDRLLGYIDLRGKAFNLLSIDIYRIESFNVYSSGGGRLDVPYDGRFEDTISRLEFSGPQWENLSWITFDPGSGAGAPLGFMGNFRMSIPAGTIDEPSSLAVVFLCAMAFTCAARRRRG